MPLRKSAQSTHSHAQTKARVEAPWQGRMEEADTEAMEEADTPSRGGHGRGRYGLKMEIIKGV
jgi:hypothetical protein